MASNSQIPRDFRDWASKALEQGWRIRLTRGGHLQWLPPTGPIVVLASTASDHRAYSNARSMLRRAGLEI